MVNYWYATALGFNCDFNKAVKHVQAALEVNTRARSVWGMSAMKSNLSVCLNMASMIPSAHKTSNEALKLAVQSGDVLSGGLAHGAHGCSCYYTGEFGQAKRHLFEALKLCPQFNLVGWVAYSHRYIGEILYYTGEHDQSAEHFDQSADTLDRGQAFPSYMRYCKACVTRSGVLVGDHNIDLDGLRQYVDSNRMSALEPYIARVIAEVLFTLDADRHFTEAHHWLQKALEADTKYRTHCRCSRSTLK